MNQEDTYRQNKCYIQYEGDTAYIGLAKEPLMKVQDGHGFLGVLMQNKERNMVQCHKCGGWMKFISTFHLTKCLGITAREYKKKYGLNLKPGLISDAHRLDLTKNILHQQNSSGIERFQRNIEVKQKAAKTRTYNMQQMNRTAMCPLQIQERLYEFIRTHKCLPTRNNDGKNLYDVLKRRFGSFGLGLVHHGLPFVENIGNKRRFTFSDGQILEFNMLDWGSRNLFFDVLLKKCPVLSTPHTNE